MKASPKVSVIIPNYNHSKYLPKRIESVLHQTITDLEVVILDDNSKDESREIILEYAAQDSRIRFFSNEVNSGSVFKQWKKGVDMASGEYVWIAESDDYAHPLFLERLLPILESRSSIGFAYTNSLIVDEDDKKKEAMSIWKNSRYRTDRWSKDHIINGQKELESYLCDNCTINNASAVLFRKSILHKCYAIDDSLRFAGDWMAYIKVAARYDIAYISECLNYYRSHSNNASKGSETRGDIYIERVHCLSEAYKGIIDKASKKKVLNSAAIAFVDVLYSCLKLNRSISRLIDFTTRLIKRNALFFFKMQGRVLPILLSKI